MSSIPQTAKVPLGLVVLFSLLLAPFPTGSTEFLQTLSNAAHGPMFAVTAIYALLWLRANQPQLSPITSYATAMAASITLGGIAEIAQYLFTTTRHAEWGDLLTDSFGSVAGLSLFAGINNRTTSSQKHKHIFKLVGIGATGLVLLPVFWSASFYLARSTQVPDLVTWSSRWGHHFVHGGGANISIREVPQTWATTNEKSLLIAPISHERWAGVTIEEPLPDWTDYQLIAVDAINPDDHELRLTLRIDDRAHNQEYSDRYNGELRIDAKQRAILRIPISEIQRAPAGRSMDMKHISKVLLFEDTHSASQEFYLVGMKLESRVQNKSTAR